MPSTRSSEGGFTLLESLVALAILATSLTVILSIVSNSHASQKQADARWRMALLADALLQKAGLEADLVPGHWEGVRDDLKWNVDVKSLVTRSMPNRSALLYEIRVSVASQSSRVESVEMATLRLAERNL